MVYEKDRTTVDVDFKHILNFDQELADRIQVGCLRAPSLSRSRASVSIHVHNVHAHSVHAVCMHAAVCMHTACMHTAMHVFECVRTDASGCVLYTHKHTHTHTHTQTHTIACKHTLSRVCGYARRMWRHTVRLAMFQ